MVNQSGKHTTVAIQDIYSAEEIFCDCGDKCQLGGRLAGKYDLWLGIDFLLIGAGDCFISLEKCQNTFQYLKTFFIGTLWNFSKKDSCIGEKNYRLLWLGFQTPINFLEKLSNFFKTFMTVSPKHF